MKSHFLLLILLIVFLTGCNNKPSSPSDTYLGGLIVNPTSKFVVLLRENVVVDTFYLDKQNKFGGKLKNPQTGLYVFKHPPENQTVYLEPGDSTLILLNTVDFDESLNFSGKGSEKSNYLNEMYLSNQRNNDLILSYYKLEPVEFARLTDSILQERQLQFDKLNKKHSFSKEFIELAKSCINYEYYDLRERYIYLVRTYSKDYINKIPSDFLEYRNSISLNDEKLQDYYVYLNLLDDLIRAKSTEECNNDNPKCPSLIKKDNLGYRIILVDSILENERIKNSFIERLAAKAIIYSTSKEEIISVLDLLEQIEYKGDRLPELRQLAGIQNGILPGNNIGDLTLIDIEGNEKALNKVSSRPKITYHWSVTAQSHYKWQQNVVRDLKKKFPEVDFIGVNIDKNDSSIWQKIVLTDRFSNSHQYKIKEMRVNDLLLKNYLNRLLFLDTSGKIVKGDTKLDSPDFEADIEEFVINR